MAVYTNAYLKFSLYDSVYIKTITQKFCILDPTIRKLFTREVCIFRKKQATF